MSLEIERKFLVKNDDFKRESFAQKSIKQGYLNSDKNRTVRVRIADEKAFMTIKGKSNATGTTRFEWEKEIDKSEAESLLLLCEPSVIDKTRYLIKVGDHTFEVDEFYGDNQGLTVAEVELNSETETFTKPNWLDQEVTGDVKYYNSSISKHPFKDWI
ncbi:CYTH domain-containing protein [Polaribacter sp. R2A056_3_33]|uniref:CYTH domain-containing protein n=1 Tax=unclassified Polaribacter TaxID=196858 RepID=UPI001C4FE578|nr:MULTISPECIES: CYTH domain-containing protein [unclassified Polaribacter]QXP63473.1 CYTH domain-containing protein [Polaribacter sp. HaHaR_3_91]QXP71467.1 CYTH domain-containing protein [Polaribacter sp. R2A056_3_33]